MPTVFHENIMYLYFIWSIKLVTISYFDVVTNFEHETDILMQKETNFVTIILKV